MSLFYKNQRRESQQVPSNQGSIVRPYNAQQQHSVMGTKKIQPRTAPPVVDPTFPHRQAAQPQQQQGLRKSILLANRQDQKQSWLTKCCSCPKLESFKKFYKVTNKDVLKRALLNLQFWRTGFFAEGQEYDFYGPFWIYTTVIFCLSAVPNILLYQGSQNFKYNFEIVGLAFGFIYLQGFLFPVALTFLLKMLGVNCTYIQNICIYGYSMCAVIICLLLCSINVCLLHIILLAYAFATKAWFIFNNMRAAYNIPVAKKALIMGLVFGEAALQFFVVKIFFINCAETQPSVNPPATQNHQGVWFHARKFVI